MKSVLEPLFNRRTFLAFCLLMCLVASASWFLRKTDRAPESVEIDPSSRLAVVPSAYQHGYVSGFDAFLKQTGQYAPRPAVASYTSSKEYSMDDKEVERGYVDGYHKAAELQNCPRSHHEY